MSRIKKDRIIKGLKSQIKKLEGEAESIKIEVSNKQREYNAKLNQAKNIQEELDKLDNDKTLRVTEHAIVRYLERVKGVNISEIEKEILNSDVLKMVNTLGGTGGYPTNGFKVLIKDYTVTTIIN